MNNCSWPYYAQPSFIIRFDTLGQVIERFSGFFPNQSVLYELAYISVKFQNSTFLIQEVVKLN